MARPDALGSADAVGGVRAGGPAIGVRRFFPTVNHGRKNRLAASSARRGDP
jgi:hypothetical protein